MENKIEEYKKQFKVEKLELIVRISWCGERGCSNFSMIENFYKAEAHIDKALNVKTGELIEVGMHDRIEWLFPKKIFGFKYGYKFKKGNMYRILVREYIHKENEKFKKYYLEQVLEKNINEPRLDTLYNFENKFEEKVIDLTVLIKRSIDAWGIIGSIYRNPTATFIASIDSKTNELSESHGTLTWMEKDNKSKIKFNFDAMGTYIVKVRKSKENNNSYLLLNVLGKVTDDRFDNIKEEYLKPIVINNELGEFTLDRDYNWFEGQIDYLGEKCSVLINVEEGETTIDTQLNKLKEIFSDLTNWDSNVKKYASHELLELSNEWSEDGTEITEEQFIKRIGMPSITVNENGTVEVSFDSDNMFTDHSIVIYVDENGIFEEADIVG